MPHGPAGKCQEGENQSAVRAALKETFRGKGLFAQFSRHMNTVVKLGAGNFIGCTLFCGPAAILASARSSVEAVALTL